jgi:acyl-CoA reductase-like NAD-dependent aldehyde dehydrogenase
MHEIISPVNSQVYKQINLVKKEHVQEHVESSVKAQQEWAKTSLSDRLKVIDKFIEFFVQDKEEIATELSWCLGRPRAQNFNEVKGVESRARYMMGIAESSLKDSVIQDDDQFKRIIKRVPLGIVFVIGAWNYPYLVTVNAVVPALIAGNSVILKQAPQTFPCADRFALAFKRAGLPDGVFQAIHMDHQVAQYVIECPQVSHIQFVGSVRGGSQVSQAAAARYVSVGLELGGNDPAYVRHDADPKSCAENIVDGAMYNSGQSCCGVQRVYVHEKVYDEFVKHVKDVVSGYKLGNPLEEGVTLGPMVNTEAANSIRHVIQDAGA